MFSCHVVCYIRRVDLEVLPNVLMSRGLLHQTVDSEVFPNVLMLRGLLHQTCRFRSTS